MCGVDKYVRQLNIIGNECLALLKECQMDEQLTEIERHDITWELYRAQEQLEQAAAALECLELLKKYQMDEQLTESREL